MIEAVRNNKICRNAVIAMVLLGVGAPQSWAWGREGHRLTALVAEHYLTPEARAEVAELLHNQTMADIASWADDYRTEHPETAPWHYVDIPGNQAKFDRDRDCPLPPNSTSPWRDCVTDRILYFEGRLGDTTLPTEERGMALKFLVHLIGDVHQPFHAIGDARGGNEIRVTFLGSRQCGTYTCNLHGVWDESILEHEGLNEKKFTAHLIEAIDANHWERMNGGEPTTWANISHHYAVEALAPDGAMLNREYVNEESKVVDAQLALGGLRLARVLNRLLKAPEDDQSQPGRAPLPKAPAETPPQP
jgi:hypothetical protein